ncbi:hypothetical protein M404DRAFT_774963 [Pisolithus tinctorius Marx 270]|uniref:Uncharacterized protein n=1 Tax=Pisolithus tinctorius Marx 270 TaxID=870435 RepID=A0A0C3NX81_PISTI|nr:hypothetical protein M404DRAFT_774963 [Pisolithus tinctorius Marx 270]
MARHSKEHRRLLDFGKPPGAAPSRLTTHLRFPQRVLPLTLKHRAVHPREGLPRSSASSIKRSKASRPLQRKGLIQIPMEVLWGKWNNRWCLELRTPKGRPTRHSQNPHRLQLDERSMLR